MWSSRWSLIWLLFLVSAVLCPTAKACFQYSSSLSNPCLDKDCSFGAECIPTLNGHTAECVCPAKCPSYGDSRDSRPICGSDGHDYVNLCELNRHACSLVKSVSVRYNGSCDPCYGVKCPDSQICQIDDNRNPICKCNAACGKEFEPVCGSDGNTYVNQCILRVEACKTRKSLRILHQGSCAESNSCKALKCTVYQECEVNRYGIAVCQCPSTCSRVLKPVCGTDGETYDSECELKRQACINHHNVSIRYLGACEPKSFCHQNHGTCKFGSICMSTGLTNYSCVCADCSEEYSPVCGSNGITYTNLCKFRQDMCQKKTTNVTLRQGTCAGCENINCMHYSYCEANARGSGQCLCPTHCEKTYEPVCGSDLVSYGNECELRASSCQRGQYIVPIKRSACTSCEDLHCDYGARCENGVCVCPRKCLSYYEPVCGSDNITYQNECKLMAASCESTTQISVRSKGPCEDASTAKGASQFGQLCPVNTCKYDGVCVVDDKHSSHCLCNFNCSSAVARNEWKICGSDGRTYQSECIFREEMCNRQQEIKSVERLFCEKYRNIPCEGEPPLLNEASHKDYNCTAEDCPGKSYCHRGLNFAKCCRESDPDEDCFETTYGCCPDEKTTALGPNYSGCPSTCQCNRLGSYLLKCHSVSRQCFCKPGVGGLRCDRCEAGFWGLHKISEGNAGCIPCKCNKIGSSRDDCEQMTGRCVCKPAFKGMKCDICADGSPVELSHCIRAENTSCSDHSLCKFGASCVNSFCQCDIDCSQVSKAPVCANDGAMYDSECHLKLWSCKIQKSLTVAHLEKCRSSTTKNSATTSPVRRSTEHMDKSTREVSMDGESSIGTGPTMPTLHWETESESWPFFAGNGYIEMITLQAYSKVNIQVELIPYEPDGLILFNAQSSTGEGDYIALLLRNAYVEFRFNLGSGSVLIRSERRIDLAKSVYIRLGRHLSEGFLSVDGQEEVSGKSEGPHKLLDLGQSLFLGGTPYAEVKRLGDMLGTKKNFTGCVRGLRINEQVVQLDASLSKHILNYVQIEPCSRQKCSHTYCRKQGICVQGEQQYSCLCADNFTGQRCQHKGQVCTGGQCSQVLSVDMLDFWNNSYVQLPTLQGVNQAFTLEVWFMARSVNGLILYNGQSQGDFVQLSLVEGFVYYSFNLGGQSNKSGIVSIRSRSKLSLGEWHRLFVTRKSKVGSLQVNAETVVKETAKGNLNELNLDEPLYLGGTGEIARKSSQSSASFNGAIQKIALNGQLWRNMLNRSSKAVNIQNYQGPPCGYENPCENQAKCLPWLNSFICQCPKGFHGVKCDKTMDSRMEATVIGNFIQIEYNSSVFQSYKERNTLEIIFRTKSANGLILWTSKDSKVMADYLSIVMVDGFIEFSFDLGKQTHYSAMQCNFRVDDGEVHTVIVTRDKQIGVLQVDEKFMSSMASEEGATDLNTDGHLWIGGHSELPSGLPSGYYTPFEGCLLSVRVQGIAVDLSNHARHLTRCE